MRRMCTSVDATRLSVMPGRVLTVVFFVGPRPSAMRGPLVVQDCSLMLSYHKDFTGCLSQLFLVENERALQGPWAYNVLSSFRVIHTRTLILLLLHH